jgi:membrane protein DedA with SNARE-associated domain
MHGFQEWIAHWFSDWIGQLGYLEIFVLMALESSLFPVPSELVMIPAGYLAKTGQLNPWLAIATGGAGSLVGASVNYLIGRTLGRAFLLRYGKYLLINERKYHEAETLFLKNAYIATFIGRLLPVVRHLISLPAGVFGMRCTAFAAITLAGATLWCGVLVAIGYCFGESAIAIISHYTHEVTLVVMALLAMGAIWFMVRRR